MGDDRQHPRGFSADEMNEMRRISREGGSVEEHLLASTSALPPLLKAVWDAMKERGWEVVQDEDRSGHSRRVLYRKRGRVYGSLDEAVMAQTMQEISDQVIDGN